VITKLFYETGTDSLYKAKRQEGSLVTHMETRVIKGPAHFDMALIHSAFVPFHNLWGMNSYFLTGKFDLDIQTLGSGSTSGSPVVATGQQLAGFLKFGPGRVTSQDGSTIHFEIPEGQSLLVIAGGTEREQWACYNATVEAPTPPPRPRQAFWSLPEYVTWVEQEVLAYERGGSPFDHLNEAMVRSYIGRVEALGLPPGKLTIDAGWYLETGRRTGDCDGTWRVDPRKFPDMERLCGWIKSRGFIPGLWFGLPQVAAAAPFVRERPELFDHDVRDNLAWEGAQTSEQLYHRPSPEVTAYYREVFAPYVAMGFRKFKLDYFGGQRARMTGLIRCAHEAITSLDPTIEIEGHHPDIFYSRWVDTIRIHDVVLHNGWDWQGLTLAHLRVGELCVPDRLINLDHVGGNLYLGLIPAVRILPSEEDYIRHSRLFDLYDGLSRYPVVSLLPDRFGPEARKAVKIYLEKHRVKTP